MLPSVLSGFLRQAIGVCCVVIAAASFAPQSFAYFPVPEDVDAVKFRELADDLRCPTCTGLSVLNSDEKFATQIKEKIVEQMRAGQSQQEIMVYFVERYGPWILREPPKAGFHLWAWILPGAMLLLGPPLIYFFIWRRRRSYNTLGVRAEDALIAEMMERLGQMRSAQRPQS